MSKCSVCNKSTRNNDLKITCSECKNLFHGTCINMNKDDIDFILNENKSWFCDPCSSARRSSMHFESVLRSDVITNRELADLIKSLRDELKKRLKNM